MVVMTLRAPIKKPILKKKDVLENIVIKKENSQIVGGSIPTFKAIDDVEPLKKPKKLNDMKPSVGKDRLKVFFNFKFKK